MVGRLEVPIAVKAPTVPNALCFKCTEQLQILMASKPCSDIQEVPYFPCTLFWL